MNKTATTRSAKQTQDMGKALAGRLRPGTALLLEGDLGSGKTTFVKGIAQGLGFKQAQDVKSPTFVLLHIYEARIPVYHFDLYRLENETELEALGLDEFLNDPRGICCIEWAEKAGSYAPPAAVRVRFQILGPQLRKIKIEMKAA